MPKAASGSIARSLKIKVLDKYFTKLISHDIRKSNYLSLANYMKVNSKNKFAFTFVRNPWDRLVSAFFYLNGGGGINSGDKSDFTKYLEKYEGDFTTFVNEAFKNDEIFEQIHFRPQHKWITDENNSIVTDYIGKYENLQADYDYVMNKNWRFKRKLGHFKNSKRLNYKELYSKETREIVSNAYAKDIKLFNYEF